MDQLEQENREFFTKNEDKYIEILFLIGAIITPPTVLIWELFIPGKPFYLKIVSWTIALSVPLFFCLKYFSPFIKRNLRIIFYTICYVISAYVVYLVYYDNFSKEYLLLLMLVVFYIVLTFETLVSLFCYLVTILVLVILAIFFERIYENVYDRSGLVILISFTVFSIMAVLHLAMRNQSKRELNEMAFFDSLTKLPNRNSLYLHLKNVFESSKGSNQQVSLMLIDFDKLKNINDTMGHLFGDVALKAAAMEIKKCLKGDDFIARYGGDVFIAVLEDARPKQAEQIAQKMIKIFSAPLIVRNHRVDMTMSIGISHYPSDSDQTDTLIKYADIAMHQAKSKGRNNYFLFDHKMHEFALRKVRLENELRRALQNQEFIVHYQPQIDFGTGMVSGAEALIRWQHPKLGMIPPNEFIPIAEETGLIIPIGEWILKTASKERASWQRKGLPPVTLAVNVSYHQLRYNGFIQSVHEALQISGLHPRFLELEITESVLRDAVELKNVQDELKEIGIILAIDDFGVGYSSLSMLQHVIINNLKIDMSFIRHIPQSTKVMTIVKTIIDMGKNLNCKITAEGVETVEQAWYLKENGCDLGQGYLFSRPLNGKDFERFLRDWRGLEGTNKWTQN